MIAVPMLLAHLREGSERVAVRHDGVLLDIDPSDAIGPATMLVAEVTDALKRVSGDGMVVGPVDRSSVAKVEAVVLAREVVNSLEASELTLERLLKDVIDAGVEWAVAPAAATRQV